jgi:hypothetical protein
LTSPGLPDQQENATSDHQDQYGVKDAWLLFLLFLFHRIHIMVGQASLPGWQCRSAYIWQEVQILAKIHRPHKTR